MMARNIVEKQTTVDGDKRETVILAYMKLVSYCDQVLRQQGDYECSSTDGDVVWWLGRMVCAFLCIKTGRRIKISSEKKLKKRQWVLIHARKKSISIELSEAVYLQQIRKTQVS